MQKRLQTKKLYDPEKLGHGVPVVDVVLVHGLDGDPVETWEHITAGTKSQRRTVWPEDLLPKILPRVRVLSFGYNGDMYRSNSVAGIRGNAGALLSHLKSHRYGVDQTRPIVFVAHCLGGLIVKQALCFASVQEHHKHIASATKTIMFFGTPHCGAEEGQWKLLAQRYSQLPGSQGQAASLVTAILRDSDDLAEISEDFCQVALDYKVVSFYETETWQKTGQLIVDQTSARMELPGEYEVAVGADHLGMCRFADEYDMTFQTVWQEIKDVAPASAETRRVITKGGETQWEITVEESDEDGDDRVSGTEKARLANTPVNPVKNAPKLLMSSEERYPNTVEEVLGPSSMNYGLGSELPVAAGEPKKRGSWPIREIRGIFGSSFRRRGSQKSW